jgi:hypothetical protein
MGDTDGDGVTTSPWPRRTTTRDRAACTCCTAARPRRARRRLAAEADATITGPDVKSQFGYAIADRCDTSRRPRGPVHVGVGSVGDNAQSGLTYVMYGPLSGSISASRPGRAVGRRGARDWRPDIAAGRHQRRQDERPGDRVDGPHGSYAFNGAHTSRSARFSGHAGSWPTSRSRPSKAAPST